MKYVCDKCGKEFNVGFEEKRGSKIVLVCKTCYLNSGLITISFENIEDTCMEEK